MPRSDWGELAKVGGLAVIVSLLCARIWFVNNPQRPNLPAYQYGQPAQSDYYPGGSGCKPDALARLTGQKALSERDRCAEYAEDHRHDSDDLVQQTRAANAATSSAIYAYDQTRMMLLEVIGGVITLIAAAFAAIYARKAAIHTEEGAREARRAASAAEKQLESSLHSARACITPEGERVRLDEGDPPILRVEYHAKNTGQTSAHGLIFSSSMFFRPRKSGPDIHLGTSMWNQGTIGPSHPVELFLDVHLTDGQLQLLKGGLADVTISLHGLFLTVFEERWELQHDLVIEPQSLKNGLVYTSDMKQGPAKTKEDEELANHEPGLDFEDDDP
jgi:hypothetical protein